MMAPTVGCGLLTSARESSSDVEVVVPERDDSGFIPTPAKDPPLAGDDDGGGSPGGSGVAGSEGDGTETADGSGSTGGGTGAAGGGSGNGGGGTRGPATTKAPRPLPTVMNTVPIPTDPPRATTTTTTIDPSTETDQCKSMRGFIDASIRLALGGVTATIGEFRVLVDGFIAAMNTLKLYVPEPVLRDVVDQDWLIVAIAVGPTANDSRIAFLKFIDIKRDNLEQLFSYLHSTCKNLPRGPGSFVPSIEDANDFWGVA